MVHISSHSKEHNEETQGLVVAGGGERNGMEGNVVGIGIVGIEGMLESGGKVTFGAVGRVGIEGIAGSGGKVGLRRRFGREGKFGNCRRLRVALPPQNDKAMKRAKKRHLKVGMVDRSNMAEDDLYSAQLIWSSGHQRTDVVAPLEKAAEASTESGRPARSSSRLSDLSQSVATICIIVPLAFNFF
ncbi:hypothetical protein SADUNF_Sadunf17G0043600 [Salix dunnii]|uniref:Uncharacterized protein n=1 Tax=Salix dunnii TaxID=1413687 RepID=A0A835J6E8_9ROSI|nr:hypothetical protein SADUNF_Sadunf17G0043600 [Salix dunnii]